MSSFAVQLRPGREKPALCGHPWIFSGAIREWTGRPAAGDAVDVFSSEGDWIARGLASPSTGLAVRLYTRRRDEGLDGAFWADRIRRAVQLRRLAIPDAERTDAYRLVFSEADGLSGLIVDRYGDTLALRVGAAALVPHLRHIVAALRDSTGLASLHADVDRDGAEREGFEPAAVRAFSTCAGGPVAIRQDGLCFEVDLAGGQKTGFYLDQRLNRARVAAYAAGRSVLSCYCYTGALEIFLAKAGAREIVAIDSSAPALHQARRHAAMNAIQLPVEWVEADVPAALRGFRDRSRSFDMIVLDPPKFILTPGQRDKGLRAYKDINLLAMKLLAPGGVLATFSCSGLVTRADLEMVLGWAAKDAGRTVQILEQPGQPPDHPVLVGVPETEYLCGFICTVH